MFDGRDWRAIRPRDFWTGPAGKMPAPPSGATGAEELLVADEVGDGEVGEKISPFKGVPIISGGAGLGGRAHAANEYYVIEGADKVYGMAGAEKAVATLLYAFAGKIPPKSSTTN